ncbi:outer membrane protein assembly factor BamB family protein [Amycolatopsis alkalitolerans]|uniref:outer membrane protein assembly factor BamB family protein n=1 Tax=Amycolatopsis alkalitolerans TaxID=2547244 RepID=UPI0013571009|nr:PQQ-binding-like beta-propeller repeat protein [Amycolatopsis alkalitolerans]
MRASKTLAAVSVALMMVTAACGRQDAGSPPGSQFPATWTVYGGNPEHNAVFDVPGDAQPWVRDGVSWQFREAMGLPLDGGPQDENVLGYLAASVKTTQMIGNAVGVTAVDGKIFAESDWNRAYALDAKTGKKLWETELMSEAMGNPVVADGLVFVGVGDTGFSFSNVQRYAAGGQVNRGMGYGAVSALDERTGKEVWHFSTVGEDMPSVVYLKGRIYFGNGDGHMYALDAKTGKPAWVTQVGGFDSMSSANYWHDPRTGRDLVVAGFSAPNYLYAFDAETGKVAWKATVPGVYNTGMGDNTPTVDSQRGLVFQDSVVDFDQATKTSDLALFGVDASSGKVTWETKLGRGPSPLAYKAAISMVRDGVVYVGNPATGFLTALDETSGRVLWRTDLGTYTWKGKEYHIQNRGGPVFYHGVLYQAAGAYVFAVDPASGRVLSRFDAGGRYGIVNPVIVGGTMYLGNSWGWVTATPMSKVHPGGG